MTRWLMLWKFNPLAIPADRELAMKVRTALNDRVKGMLDAGSIQDWGVYADASGGYALWDDKGDADPHLMLSLTTSAGILPFVSCDVRPVLDIDQSRASIR